MIYNVQANKDLSEVLNQKPVGEPVNPHVVSGDREPRPDFEEMRKVVYGSHPSEERKPASQEK